MNQKSHFHLSFIFIGLITASTIVSAASGPFYTDFEVSALSSHHLVIRYTPKFSNDFQTFQGADQYPIGDTRRAGRSLLVALPPDGELAYTFSYATAGRGSAQTPQNYISAEMPLVIREKPFVTRGHRLSRIVVFPQRMENGTLAAYTDFVIDIRIEGEVGSFPAPATETALDRAIAQTVINPEQFRLFTPASPPRPSAKPAVSILDSADLWVKISVIDNGMTRITGAALQQAGLSLTNLRSDSLRLFYSGGILPPDDPSASQPALVQVPIRIVDGGDGLFGATDYLIFYGEAPSRFRYTTGQPVYYRNSYDLNNYYWLSIGGQNGLPVSRWETISGAPSTTPDLVLSTCRQPIRLEQNNLIKISSDGRFRDFYNWYWSDQPIISVTANLPAPIPGDSVDIELTAACLYNLSSVTLNGFGLTRYISGGINHFWSKNAQLVDGVNTIRLDLEPLREGAFLDYLNLSYTRRLRYAGQQLEFNSSGGSGLIEYRVSGTISTMNLCDISIPQSPQLIQGGILIADTLRFHYTTSSPGLSRFIVFETGNLKSPASIERAAPGNLREDLAQFDCLMIAPQRLHAVLQEYVDYRLADGLRVKIVALDEIYDHFAFGFKTPLAIRNYFKYAFENYAPPAPYAVILVGDGHYDFHDNLGLHNPIVLPPFIWGREDTAGDDNYVYFGRLDWLDSDSSYTTPPDRGWDMMSARWPVNSSEDVTQYIAKVKRYESAESQGEWRSRLTFVADDEYKDNTSTEIIHTAQSEELVTLHTPTEYIARKIYATDYPFASSGDKPTVNDAIVAAINNGTLMINYIGHGSPDVWADEHIFRKESELGRLNNPDKLTVVVAASCSIGFYDDPRREGMAELMFRQHGGAIQTVSATRLVYSDYNAKFNYDLYDAFFSGSNNVCASVFAVKMLHQYFSSGSLLKNDRAYVVFGDPLGRSGLPEYRIRFDVSTDSIMTPLDRFQYSGEVIDEAGQPVVVNGRVNLAVFDSRIKKQHELGLEYSLGGPTIFSGTTAVSGGRFAGGFVVPLDVNYGGPDAQLAVYGEFGAVAAIGGQDSIAISAQAALSTDKEGPEITYAIAEVPDFVSGGKIPANATLMISLSDSSGINITGALGHRIELTIDGDNISMINLTGSFVYDEGSYRTGRIQFQIPELDSTLHAFRLRAWDNANNPSSVEFFAAPSQGGRISIANLMNYPNPMKEKTEFYFELTEAADWAELQIFTLAGRLIKRIRASDLSVGRNRAFAWNGRDLDGDRVAEGVYLYRLAAKGMITPGAGSTDILTEAFGKLVLIN